jgi:hypothetical protein
MVFNAPSFSGAGLASLSAAIHFILQGGIVLVAFFLAFAVLAGVAKVACDAMGPAVGDFVACVVCTL